MADATAVEIAVAAVVVAEAETAGNVTLSVGRKSRLFPDVGPVYGPLGS